MIGQRWSALLFVYSSSITVVKILFAYLNTQPEHVVTIWTDKRAMIVGKFYLEVSEYFLFEYYVQEAIIILRLLRINYEVVGGSDTVGNVELKTLILSGG